MDGLRFKVTRFNPEAVTISGFGLAEFKLTREWDEKTRWDFEVFGPMVISKFGQ
jgi:hypothetical protein